MIGDGDGLAGAQARAERRNVRNEPLRPVANRIADGDKWALATYCEFAYSADLPRRSANGLVLHLFHGAAEEHLGFGWDRTI